MISYRKACQIAYDKYKEIGYVGLQYDAVDLETEWIFTCYLKVTLYGGISMLGVAKETGKTRWISVPEYAEIGFTQSRKLVGVINEYVHDDVKRYAVKVDPDSEEEHSGSEA